MQKVVALKYHTGQTRIADPILYLKGKKYGIDTFNFIHISFGYNWFIVAQFIRIG